MYIHVYSSLCTYHVHTVYIRVHEIAKMYVHAWNMYMIFHFCIYHVCQPLSPGTVHRVFIHTWNMYVHVYTLWSGFQMRCLSMHAVTSHTLCIVSCRQKWKNRCADHASGKFVYPGIYWYSTVYTLTYDYNPSRTMTPKFRAAPYISDDWTSIQLPSMHVSSSPAVKSEQITFLTMH